MADANLEGVLLRGLRSAQPLATDVFTGTLYFVTDEALTEQSRGGVWVDYSAAGATAGINQLTGDVTAGPGSSSQVATIANDAVTYAKMQNISAASRLLGRGSAGGSGNTEELTVGGGLTISGTVLSSIASGLVLLDTKTASSSASLDFTSVITSTYDEYMLELQNLVPATTNVELLMRVSTNNGSSYDSGANYTFAGVASRASVVSGLGGTGQTSMRLNGGATLINTSSIGGMSGTFKLFNPLSASQQKALMGQGNLPGNDTNFYNIQMSCWYTPITAVNAFQLLMSSGNIASGVARLYGISK